MDNELRMKLADLGSPEALAACVNAHYPDIEIPIPVERIAYAVGIIDLIPQTTGSFEGVLVTDDAKSTGSIAYNNASRLERRRFTIAHEIGHFLIPWHNANAQCAIADMGVLRSRDARRSKEAEANRFAAALLTPTALFTRDIRSFGSPETEHVLALATKYRVSKEMVARRYTELCDHVCAVIFSHGGVVRYFVKSRSCPFLDVVKGSPLPPGSLSARARSEVGHLSEWTETPPAIWFGASRRIAGRLLYEQFLEQRDGYRLTMLTIDDLPYEDEPDEDQELEESWSVRFKR
jgi:Zn-dependent peptidase ImmA (M78 family)